MPRGTAELNAELDALAHASARALERLRDGDERGVVEVVERRERLLGVLSEWPVGGEPSLIEAARRAVALDTELVTTLRMLLAGVGREIDTLVRTRRSLISYGATPATSPVFVERLG